MSKIKKYLSIFCIFALVFLCSCTSSAKSTANVPDNTSNFCVTFIDVGQADAAFVECSGKYMLIDGGNTADSDLIVSFLNKKNISYIDYVVNSHPDEDHVGGLSGALANFKAGQVMSSVTEHNTKPFENFKKYTQNQGLEIEVPKYNDKFSLGSSTVEVLSPQKDYGDTNENSLVMKITYGETSFMFTGDISTAVEKDIVNSGADLKSTVLKVAHHGSKSSSSYLWLRSVLPDYAVISVGKNNSYAHPAEETLSRLRDADVSVYRTDLQGDITAVSDGKNVSFTTYKQASQSEINPTLNSSSNEDISYIGNINSKIFHKSDCSMLPKEKNRVYFSDRKEAVSQGYSPCQNCQP